MYVLKTTRRKKQTAKLHMYVCVCMYICEYDSTLS